MSTQHRKYKGYQAAADSNRAEPNEPRQDELVEVKYTEKGWVFTCGDRESEPWPYLDQVNSVKTGDQLGVEPKLVLIAKERALQALETREPQPPSATPSKKGKKEDTFPEAKVSEELQKEADKEAEKILCEPDVIAALKPHLDNVLTGEDENKALVFVLLCGGKSRERSLKQIILLKSEVGAGKTTLMTLAEAFHTKKVGRFTAHALDYTDLEGYEVLRLQEIGMMDQEFQGVSTIKFLSPDDKGYTVEATERDSETGRFTTRQYRIPPMTLITSTARVEMDPAFERRAWILNPDESQEQTNRVEEWKAKHWKERGLVDLGVMRETSFDRSMAVLKAIAEKLKPCAGILPFPKTVAKILKTERLRVRGDYDKLFALVELYGLLHQRSLPKGKGKNGVTAVLVTPETALKALKLAAGPFASMTSDLAQRSRHLISVLKDLKFEKANLTITSGDRDNIAVKLGRSERSIRRYLDEWVKAGYISKHGGGGGKRPVEYTLLYDLGSVEEKSSALLEMADAEPKFIADAAREAQEWLETVLDKMAPTDGWSKEGITRAFKTESSPVRGPCFVQYRSDSSPAATDPEKPDSATASQISNNAGLELKKEPESSTSQTERKFTCSQCSKWRTQHCVMERPDLIVETAEYASTCRGFDESKLNLKKLDEDLGTSRLASIKQTLRDSQHARVRERPESNRSELPVDEKLRMVHEKAWTLSEDGMVSKFVVADVLQRESGWKHEEVFRLLDELENRRRVSKWGSDEYLVEEPIDRSMVA